MTSRSCNACGLISLLSRKSRNCPCITFRYQFSSTGTSMPSTLSVNPNSRSAAAGSSIFTSLGGTETFGVPNQTRFFPFTGRGNCFFMTSTSSADKPALIHSSHELYSSHSKVIKETLTSKVEMRVSDLRQLQSTAEKHRNDIVDWVLSIRQSQSIAKEELYASYLTLVPATTKQKPDLTLFPTPNIVLQCQDQALIYLMPIDGRPCYGPEALEWDIYDTKLWPASHNLRAVASTCPPDVWNLLFKHLSIGDIFALGTTCTMLRILTRRDIVWEARKKELSALSQYVDLYMFESGKPLWACFSTFGGYRRIKRWKSTHMTQYQRGWFMMCLELQFVRAKLQAHYRNESTPINYMGWMSTVPDHRYHVLLKTRDGECKVIVVTRKQKSTLEYFCQNGNYRNWQVTYNSMHGCSAPFDILWSKSGDTMEALLTKHHALRDKLTEIGIF
jgi:hypothetical protein